MNDLKILTIVCSSIILISIATVLIVFVPIDSANALDRSSIIRNYILTAAGPIGILLAIWRLYSIERTLKNDTKKLSIERSVSAIKLLNSSDRATKEVAIDLIDQIRNIEPEKSDTLINALYRFFQEENRENLKRSREVFQEQFSRDQDEAYRNWINRRDDSTSPVRFLKDFAKIKEDRHHFGVYQLSLRGRKFEVSREITFFDCDLSDSQIVVKGGCSFIGCDLTRSRLILSGVKKTADISWSHCNLSYTKIEPALPDDFSEPATNRTGWFFQGYPPKVGDYFGMPNLQATVPFAFEDGGSRSVPKEKMFGIITGNLDYGSVRGFMSPFDNDEYTLSTINEATES